MKCRVCDSTDLTKVLHLGRQPWCNNFLKKKEIGKEKKYPLILMFCERCSLAQLSHTVKKEIMFSDHTYLSGITKTLSNHFKDISIDVNKRFNKDKKHKNILDIGSNDGTFLKHFKKKGWYILGVESSKRIAIIANKNNIKTINEFFNYDLAKKINKRFDFINASGIFFHLEELHSFTKGVKLLLKSDGIFIVQFLYMKSIIENTAFDQIYHEHLLYYNLLTLQNLLNKHDLEIFDCKLESVHGGQMIAYINHKNKRKKSDRYLNFLKREIRSGCNKIKYYRKFKNKVEKLKSENLKFLISAKKNKKIIFGVGAPAKGNTLLNYFNLKTDTISKLLEKNKMRKNLYAPGSHIPIVMEKEEKKIPDIYYVLAWNFKKEILKNFKKRGINRSKFYFPIKI
jgi:SAM-dependent methyltransferase